MDPNLVNERAHADRIMHQAREEMDRMIDLERENMFRRIKEECCYMDQKLQLFRGKMDRMLHEERKNMDMMIKCERERLDRMLKEECEQMDRTIQEDRLFMDGEIMQARADTDRNLLEHRDEMDLNILVQLKAQTEHRQNVNIPSPEAEEEYDTPFIPRKKGMEFRVHVVGQDYFTNPEKYDREKCGEMNFCEPLTVEWHLMVEHLEPHGFKNSSVLYYLDPTRETPNGLVEISGPTQVQEMLHSHPGTKLFHLYVVNEFSDSSSTEEAEEMANYNTIAVEDEVSSDTTNNMKRDRDSMDCVRTNAEHIEEGYKQPKKQNVRVTK